MSCEHECEKPPVFPAPVRNRPGLPSIRYRIGTYPTLRGHLFDLLDKEPLLQAWTHRGADDPGMALLEGAALVGDILTFYQELYANEAFLRTAKWKESIADLVRLTGYRLVPGLGGNAVFALAVKAAASAQAGPGAQGAPGSAQGAAGSQAALQVVTVPKGFRFKAQLEGGSKPDDFESCHEVKAYPHLSRFRLYRPPLPPVKIGAGSPLDQLDLKSVGGSSLASDLEKVGIKAGDRILLVPDSDMFDITGTAYSEQGKPEILTVDKVETILDRTVLTFKTPLAIVRPVVSMRAYRVDRNFRHFGSAAPPMVTTVNATTQEVRQFDTDYTRDIWGTHQPAMPTNLYPPLPMTEMPLEGKVENLTLGGKLICTGNAKFDGIPTPQRFAVVKTIESLRPDTLSWGSLNGSATVVGIEKKLIANDSILNESADIRHMLFYEATSPELTLASPRAFADGPFDAATGASDERRLRFFGTRSELAVFKGRKLLLEHEDGRRQQVTVTEAQHLPFHFTTGISPFITGISKFAAGLFPGLITSNIGLSLSSTAATKAAPETPALWTLTLDAKPGFVREDFDEKTNKVWVYGNLVEATQGKSEGDQVLGDGDSRVRFQTFPLPKSPLTFLLNPGRTPSETPELEIYVEGILWTQVDTFFASGPKDQVYIVRQDEQDKSLVQFGDGKTGARLPSGRGNVVARFRTGLGAHGSLRADATPQAGGKLPGLDKVFLPLPVTGGASPENPENARMAAPAKLQSLGRMVSLADYEAECLALPGVDKVRAHWGLQDGSPLLKLVVLTESGDPADLDAIEKSMRAFNRCRGPARFPLQVAQGRRRYVYLQVTAGLNPARREVDVKRAVEAALGMAGAEGDGVDGSQGLFGAGRRFGQSAHSSQVLAAVQNAEGVDWARLLAARVIPQGNPPENNPARIPLPAPALHDNLNCSEEEILALYVTHLVLSFAKAPSAGECSL